MEQSYKPKKIPMRQCLGCNEHKPKKEMIRVLRTPEGEIVLDLVGKKIEPCIERNSSFTQARKLIFDGGNEGYLICSFANETVCESIRVKSCKKLPFCYFR